MVFIFTVQLPCIVTEWNVWTVVDATGVSYRYRYIVRPALNGGAECPPLIQSKKGESCVTDDCGSMCVERGEGGQSNMS